MIWLVVFRIAEVCDAAGHHGTIVSGGNAEGSHSSLWPVLLVAVVTIGAYFVKVSLNSLFCW